MPHQDTRERIFQLFELGREHHERTDGMSQSMKGEALVLQKIYDHGGRVSPGELSQELHMTSPRVAAVLRSLEKKKVVTKSVDPGDRRRFWVELTDLGKEMVKKKRTEFVQDIDDLLDFLGEEDAAELVRLTERVMQWKPKHPPMDEF